MIAITYSGPFGGLIAELKSKCDEAERTATKDSESTNKQSRGEHVKSIRSLKYKCI